MRRSGRNDQNVTSAPNGQRAPAEVITIATKVSTELHDMGDELGTLSRESWRMCSSSGGPLVCTTPAQYLAASKGDASWPSPSDLIIARVFAA